MKVKDLRGLGWDLAGQPRPRLLIVKRTSAFSVQALRPNQPRILSNDPRQTWGQQSVGLTMQISSIISAVCHTFYSADSGMLQDIEKVSFQIHIFALHETGRRSKKTYLLAILVDLLISSWTLAKSIRLLCCQRLILHHAVWLLCNKVLRLDSPLGCGVSHQRDRRRSPSSGPMNCTAPLLKHCSE